ncbi:hypothetical protein DL93DRAFT_2077473 [Clavulina sp. PMI_390]|nr:hypothetical protein DL93DRAFT_2077473 [Clavulina sp. PMI_390]
MRAATSVALIALLAAPAFAAPISSAPVEEEPSITTQVISSAAGGAASGAVGNLLTKIESLFRRDFDERSTGALTNIIKQAQTLSTSDKATVKTALMNKIGTLQGKRDDSELEARAPLSATGLGGSLLSSAAGGAASGLVGNLLGEVEKLFRRDDFELEARSPLSSAPVEEEPSITTQVISSAAGGAASGAVGNLLSKVSSLVCPSTTKYKLIVSLSIAREPVQA